jgi:hypothetical protein
MVHTIIYLGRYSLNFERLRSHAHVSGFMGRHESGAEWSIEAASPKVDGIVFGYMEKGKEGLRTEDAFYAVAVDDVVLQSPLKLDRSRHTDGKGFGPTASQFGDRAAQALLEDVIKANQDQIAELREVQRRCFGTAQSDEGA